jgi:hypothetical protein
MKILLFYFNKNINSSLDLFLNNCIDKEKITEKIIINKIDKKLQNLNMKQYYEEFIKYDYIIYIDDNYIFNKKFQINEYIKILNDNNFHQIFFCKNKSKYAINQNNIINTDYKYFNFKTKKKLESSLTTLENSNKLNYKNKNLTSLDYLEYINIDNVNWPHFKLLPSIIKSEIFKKLKKFDLSLNYYDRNFAKEYIKYFKSCSLENYVCEESLILKKKGDPNDMTIITGFINIPHEGNKIKNSCVKKHEYNYLEKSIPTLKIKQYMVIYIPKNLYTHVYNIRKNINYLDKTKIIIIEDNFLYMKEHLEKIGNNCKKNIDTYKNPYYIAAVSTRYNFVRDSIKKNYFNTNYSTWVDFSVSHIVNIKENTLFYYNDNKFRIGWIARYKKNKFTYNHYVLSGGIFGGPNYIVKLICDLHDKIFYENMDLGYNCNDDKTLWFIFEQYPELFDTYFTGYVNIALRFSK